MQVTPQVAQEWPAVVGQDGGQPGRRVEGVRDRQEVRRLEPAAAHRPLDPRPDVVGAPDPDVGTFLQQAQCLVGLVEGPGDHDGSDDGSRASASRRDGPNDVAAARRSRIVGNSSRAIERGSIVVVSRGRW